jgi:hypothetical protein
MIINLDRFIGAPPDSNLETKVASVAESVALADTRIQRVNSEKTEVTFNSRREELSVRIVALTEEGQQELVFNV